MKNIIVILVFVIPFGTLFVLNLIFEVPFDPKDSFDRAQKNQSVIVAHTKQKCENALVDEAMLIKDFLTENKLNAHWKEVSFHHGVQLLHDRKIHILLGCFRESDHYPKLSFTRPYYKDHVIAVIQGENRLITKLEKFLYRNEKIKLGGKN